MSTRARGASWITAGAITVIGVLAALLLPATAGAANGETVKISGTVYAFFDIDDRIPGSVIKVEEFPELSAPVAADGSYEIEVPDDANVTPYIEVPAGYKKTYLQTFHTSGEDLEKVHFQVTPDLYYNAFAGLLGVPIGSNGLLEECAIVSTFSIKEARDAATFDPGFKDVYPHGLPGSTATIDPVQGNTRGAIYFSAAIIPDPAETASSVDGGVLWVEVPPGDYWLEPEHPTERLAPFMAHCEDGRLVNASPPWGFYELHDGEEPNPAVYADVEVSAQAPGKPEVKRKRDGRRILKMTVEAEEELEATLVAGRGGKTLGPAVTKSLRPGERTIKAKIRKRSGRGKSRAKLMLADDDGNETKIVKKFRVPRRMR